MRSRNEQGWRLCDLDQVKARKRLLNLSDVELADKMTLTNPATVKRLLKGQFGLRRNCEALLFSLGYSEEERNALVIHKTDIPTYNQRNVYSLSSQPTHEKFRLTEPRAPVTLEAYKAQLVHIPGASFQRDGFTLTISPFQMGRTPVTVGMWQEYANAKYNGKMPQIPRAQVWKDGWGGGTGSSYGASELVRL